MELTIQDVATLLGRSERTVRHQLGSGALKGKKRQGVWYVDRADLPLTDDQRAALRARGDRLRDALESALPEAAREGSAHVLRGLLPFEATRLLLRSLPPDADTEVRDRLASALAALAEGHFEFEADAKVQAWRRARVHLAHAVARMWVLADDSSPEANRIETEIMPRMAGLLRSAERLDRRGRS